MSQIDEYFEYLEWENEGRLRTEEARRRGPEEQISYLVDLMDEASDTYEHEIKVIDRETDKWRSARPILAANNQIGIDQIVDYDESFGPYCRKNRS